jgi:hypothetical protein
MAWLKPNALGLVLFVPFFALAQYLPVSALAFWLAVEMGLFAISPTATSVALLGVQLVVAYVASRDAGRR